MTKDGAVVHRLTCALIQGPVSSALALGIQSRMAEEGQSTTLPINRISEAKDSRGGLPSFSLRDLKI